MACDCNLRRVQCRVVSRRADARSALTSRFDPVCSTSSLGSIRSVKADIPPKSGFGKILSHGRVSIPRCPAPCVDRSLRLPCSAIVSALCVIAVAHVKRLSRVGSEQTPYPIRAYWMANTRRILSEQSVLGSTNKRRISLGVASVVWPQWCVAF